ncbi:glycosyltransferase family 4 protein [Macrococcoides bohemicum]|uniref:glycosyltransferase family 4 protein n=1 Tax=Macrococcoides bohemicum TaxID=1903056 RepID=UPI002896CCFB|nr:glycosyltransferase family 4 protein [Macrococcus bohemicus]
MKLLLVTQNFYPEIGSGANRFKNLYRLLSKNNNVNVLTTNPSYPNEKMYLNQKYWNDEVINSGDDIYRISMKIDKQSKSMFMRLLYYIELGYKVRKFIKENQAHYDVLYVTTPNIFIPWSVLFLQRLKPKKVLEVRDLWPDSLIGIEKLRIVRYIYPFLKFLEKRMYRKAHMIIINNEGFREHVQNLAPAKNIYYFPNAFRRDEIEFKDVSQEFKVIYTGNIGFAQSFEQLIQISERLEKHKIKFNAVVYGVNAQKFIDYVEDKHFMYVSVFHEKSREECLEMIREHNIQLAILKDTDTFLKVLPGKIIDGIGCGVPVVTNLGGYANDLINEYQVGYSKERASTDEIIDAILQIKDDRALEEKLRKNARALVEKEFVWENNISEFEKLLNNLK